MEIKETWQAAEIKELQAFKFELICEKPGASAPVAPIAPGAPGAPSAPVPVNKAVEKKLS